jgi:hypothetical protein
MKILLSEGADHAASATILAPRRGSGSTLETLAGDPVGQGLVAEAGKKAVISAVNAAAHARMDEFFDPRAVMRDLNWLSKALGQYELGSKIGIKPTPRGFAIDDSEAERINRAEGLANGDLIAIGPNIKPKTFMNARGRVASIDGQKVKVRLDAGDRDRIERANGNELPELLPVPLGSVEKIGDGG